MRRAFAAAGLLGGVLLCASSCLSPTLPLPPPTVDSAAEGTNGMWGIAGTCSAGANVSAKNVSALARNPGTEWPSATCSPHGTYQLGIAGVQCDVVDVWQEASDLSNASDVIPFGLEPTSMDTPTNPSACP